jgi:c-di-GMP-binding flagellar brake protein YcgR
VSSAEEARPQRRFVRAPVDFSVTVIVPGHELILSGRAIDLSGGGVRVSTPSDLPSGQSVVMRFVLPAGDHEILVRGRIVLSFYDATTRRYAHGVAFTQYAQHDQDAIAKYVLQRRTELAAVGREV